MLLLKRTLLFLLVAAFSIQTFKLRGQLFTAKFQNAFSQLNTQNGLSSNFVNCSLKDRFGFLWIGTENGLNRYDGSHFKTYYHISDIASSLSNNNVTCLFEDSKGRLWVGTAGSGVSIYNSINENFESFIPDKSRPNWLRPNDYITCIYEDHLHRLWICTWGSGLYRFDEQKKQFIQYSNIICKPNSTPHSKVKAIIEDRFGKLWVGIWAEGSDATPGILNFDPETGVFSSPFSLNASKNKQKLPDGHLSPLKFIHSFYIDDKGNIWAASYLGLIRINPANDSLLVFIQTDASGNHSVNSKTIRCVNQEPGGNIIAGSLSAGLNLYNEKDGVFEYFAYNPESEKSLSNNTVKHIYKDENGILYLSTSGGGLNISIPSKKEFSFLPTSQINIGNLVPHSGIHAINTDNKGTWFLGGQFGLYTYNEKTKKSHAFFKVEAAKPSFNLSHIYISESMDLAYLTTTDGLYAYNTKTQILKEFTTKVKYEDNGRFSNVRSLIELGNDTLIFTREFNGISVYKKSTGQHQLVSENSRFIGFWNPLFKLDNNNVLAGHQNGILKKNIQNRAFTSIFPPKITEKTAHGNATRFIFKDSKGRIWFTCESGLGLLDLATLNTKLFACKLNDEEMFFNSIVEDENGGFWLNADYQIFHFNPETKVFTQMQNPLMRSNHSCGFQAMIDKETGFYYAGSDDGFYIADTRMFYKNSDLGKIKFTEIKLRDEAYKTDSTIALKKYLKLNYNQNSFSILFSDFNFSKNRNFSFEYKLEGFENKWRLASSQNGVEYTNLDPGTYTLIVKYKHLDENDSTTARITVFISKPFWKTWWFFILVGVLICMGIVVYIRWHTKALHERNDLLEQKVKERTFDLNEEKQKSEDLLLNILPEEIAAELKKNGVAEAKQHNNVTVLFTDFVNFTGISANMTPKALVAEIDRCYKGFDKIIGKYGIEKIKTIGDAYLAVAGAPNEDKLHAENAVLAAMDILEFMEHNNPMFKIRIGLHSGPVIAGIVGIKKFAYDIWGDTVNVASRMESNSIPSRINISSATYELVKDVFDCEYRGKIEAKHKGEIDMYFVNGLINSQL